MSETMSNAAIYALLDARARDQRAIILYALSIMCTALGGLMVALTAGNAAGIGMAVVIALAMAYLAFNRGEQIARTIERADDIWLNFDNRADVPPIDIDLPRPAARVIELRHRHLFVGRAQRLLNAQRPPRLGRGEDHGGPEHED